MDRKLDRQARSLIAAPRRDRELEAGSRAHYQDPAYYAKVYRDRTDDVGFYVELAKEVGGPVLEYGVGNGRIALPIARAGHEVFGVDLSAPMLQDFSERLLGEAPEVRARVRLRRGDMRVVRFARRFPLVVCGFNSLLHLYTRRDVEQFFARVRAHLTPRGLFVFDVSVPNSHELVRDPNRAYHSPRLRYPSTGQVVSYTERFDYDVLRQILFVMMEFSPVQGGASWATPLSHRQFYPQELEALLHYNGLPLTQVFGDFARGRFDRYSDTMIGFCRGGRPARSKTQPVRGVDPRGAEARPGRSASKPRSRG